MTTSIRLHVQIYKFEELLLLYHENSDCASEILGQPTVFE